MSLGEKKLISERDAARREAEAQRAGRSRALLRLRIERQQWRVQADSAAQMMSERDAARAEAEALRRERDNWKAGHDNWKAGYDEWRPAANYAQSLSTKGLLPVRMLGMHCGDVLVALVESMRTERDAAQAEIERLKAALARAEALYGHRPAGSKT